jgi:uncharacterized protein
MKFIASLFLFAALLGAQPGQRRIQAVGTASITIKPDQARVSLSVNTSATTAADATSQNATTTTNVINAVSRLIGTKGTLKTTSYSLRPDYRTVQNTTQLVGYTVTNSIEVSVNDLNLIGPVIDTGVQAGATSVGSPQFTLQNPEPVRQQALTAAGKAALADAEAIAAGLGGRAGAVVSAQEGSSYSPIVNNNLGVTAGATPTPIQAGALEISATVTVVVELR